MKRIAGSPLRTGILVFEEVEELDFVGPWEVFGVLGRLHAGSIETRLISREGNPVRAAYGLQVGVSCTFKDARPIDLIVVPGGKGARAAMKSEDILSFLRSAHGEGSVIASVCTGALILAAAGLLDGKRATTHWAALDDLRAFPNVSVDHERYIDSGTVVTSAGISAGIDMCLYLISRFLGSECAREVAHRMEYRWTSGDA